MKVDKTSTGGIVISLDAKEVPLLRYTLERASFIDTPPDRQEQILRFADDLMRAVPVK